MLVGEKVVLDAIDPEDIEWMRQQRNDPEMRKYFREWKDISKDQQLKWYASRGNNSDPNHVYFAIREIPEDGVQSCPLGCDKNNKVLCSTDLVGCCGLHYVDWRLRSAEFGVFLGAKARGKGLGREALELMFDYGFREMNLHKIWCEIYDNNTAIDFYRSFGFVDEGVLRDNYFCNGKYGNSIRMSVLEDEWFDLHGGR